jgi:hypothetical protein
MVKNKAAAKEVSNLMLEIQSKLDESIRMVRETCDEGDFKIYREAVSKVLVEILREVLNPLYSDHPSLKPERMR